MYIGLGIRIRLKRRVVDDFEFYYAKNGDKTCNLQEFVPLSHK